MFAHNTGQLTIGDLHPFILHFPIVLFFFAFVFDLIGLFSNRPRTISHWTIIIAALFTIPTVITGLSAETTHADSPYVHLHKNLALFTLAYSLLHASWRALVLYSQKTYPRYIFLIFSLINFILICATCDYGNAVTRDHTITPNFFSMESLSAKGPCQIITRFAKFRSPHTAFGSMR